ncbi:MAG: glycosyltransferase family 39 protein, partial [Candidatus Acidiferrales bacterium]
MAANFDRARLSDLPVIATTGTIALFSLALLTFGIHLAGIGRYGFFRDELYYLACGRHLAWGYVDQPPLIAVVAWLSQHAFGTSLAATRLLPAAAGALLVFLTGLLARELGGSLRAQVLAAVTILFAPAILAMNSFLSMNAFEPVFWALGAILIARILSGGSPRLWLWFGLVTGIALLNKHTMLVFGFATVVGLLASGLPREFTRRWIWLGGAIALAIFLPNLIWEAQNHWPQIEVVRNDRAVKTLALSPLKYLWEQALFMSPVSVPVALSGLVWYFSGARGKQFRPLGYIVLCSAAIFIFFKGKAYYFLPAYPILFAAGGVALEPFLFSPGREWRGKTYLAILILAGLI